MNVRSLIFILLCFVGHFYYGLSNNAVDRIIGGSDTDIKEVPYMLSIMMNGEFFCGAGIINEKWAVTAAHCMKSEDPFKEITLCSGSSKLYKNCTGHKIVKCFIHENYDNRNLDYDIAVIQVTPAFSYNDYTKPVGLPSTSNMPNEEWGKVCGWGYYKKYYSKVKPFPSENLKCVLISRMKCTKVFEKLITPRMKCYGHQEGQKGSCRGDSGGPLTSIDGILLGITSWGAKNCDRHSVYTDTILLLDWIKNNTVIND